MCKHKIKFKGIISIRSYISVKNAQKLANSRIFCSVSIIIFSFAEYLSTCWMTFILLGVSFLVFYAIGMIAFKHQTYIVLKCNNDSKPATDVFYHHVIPRIALVPFMIYSEYLGAIAVQYPNLRINVYFLIDDSLPSSISLKRSKYDRLYAYHSNKFYEEFNKREIREFHKRYPNVNTTVMLLSKYMAQTPLKYLWRSIPIAFIPFYARVYSVWQHGGIALDLPVSYTQYMTQKFDSRIADILRLHNDGVKPEEFDEILNKVSEDEWVFAMLHSLLSNWMHETKAVISKIMSCSIPPFNVTKDNVTVTSNIAMAPEALNTDLNNMKNKISIEDIISIAEFSPLVKKNESVDNSTGANLLTTLDIVLGNKSVNANFNNSVDHDNTTGDGKQNLYQVIPSVINTTTIKIKTAVSTAPVAEDNATDNNIKTNLAKNISEYHPDVITFKSWKEMVRRQRTSAIFNKTEQSQFVLVYDVLLSPNTFVNTPKKEKDQEADLDHVMKHKLVAKPEQRIFVDAEGAFISATSRFHPFLYHILNAGCKRLPPKIALREALFMECGSNYFQDKIYCNSIYVI